MKYKIVLICLLLVSFSVTMAQEKSFIINKDMNTLISRVGDFQNLVAPDGMSDAAKGDDNFITSVIIDQEQYAVAIEKNYLAVSYKKPMDAVMIASTWDITLTKLSDGKTKVTVLLTKVVPHGEGKENVDLKKTVSSGKLEKELEDFLKKEEEQSEDSGIEINESARA